MAGMMVSGSPWADEDGSFNERALLVPLGIAVTLATLYVLGRYEASLLDY